MRSMILLLFGVMSFKLLALPENLIDGENVGFFIDENAIEEAFTAVYNTGLIPCYYGYSKDGDVFYYLLSRPRITFLEGHSGFMVAFDVSVNKSETASSLHMWDDGEIVAVVDLYYKLILQRKVNGDGTVSTTELTMVTQPLGNELINISLDPVGDRFIIRALENDLSYYSNCLLAGNFDLKVDFDAPGVTYDSHENVIKDGFGFDKKLPKFDLGDKCYQFIIDSDDNIDLETHPDVRLFQIGAKMKIIETNNE